MKYSYSPVLSFSQPHLMFLPKYVVALAKQVKEQKESVPVLMPEILVPWMVEEDSYGSSRA
jgi:hypothetical protein